MKSEAAVGVVAGGAAVQEGERLRELEREMGQWGSLESDIAFCNDKFFELMIKSQSEAAGQSSDVKGPSHTKAMEGAQEEGKKMDRLLDDIED